jgi:hypothetical protein
VNGSLIQLVSAARLPSSGISEIAVNASWNMIEATTPASRLSRTRKTPSVA